MHILGISCYYHDSAAALIRDGELVAAAEEERFSRKKHDSGFPHLAIDFCLREAGIAPGDLDCAVFYEKPLLKFERMMLSSLATFPKSWTFFRRSMTTWFSEKMWIKSQIADKLRLPPNKVLFVEHHLAHAASTLFASPFEEAAILTVDGVGEWTTATMGHGRAPRAGSGGDNEITLTHEERFPHSLGLLYSAFTAFLGFRVNNGEYKVMGMSPYGEPRYVDKIEKVFKLHDDGSFWLDMDYFSYHYSAERTFNSKFISLFGKPRVHESEFFTAKTNPEVDAGSPKAKENQHYADVAASIQHVTEETVLKMARVLHEQTGSKNLCMAGGVALNSKGNGRILAETPYEGLFIQPAAGDSGGALGAALYAYHILMNEPCTWTQEHNYWGEEHGEAAVAAAAAASGMACERFDDDEKVIQRTVDAMLAGKVIGWFQGRFEWGPRALGNRSILADPRRAEMKEIVNSKIKFREPFRPFAPVVPEELVPQYFPRLAASRDHYPVRFMLEVHPWNEEFGRQVPAVNHMGTGRLQSVRREWNPRYYRLVELFGQATGVPVVLNTSFNLRGEPIVNSPADAVKTVTSSGIDMLVMDQHVLTKKS